MVFDGAKVPDEFGKVSKHWGLWIQDLLMTLMMI